MEPFRCTKSSPTLHTCPRVFAFPNSMSNSISSYGDHPQSTLDVMI
jgi:hypothetical protein